MRILLVEDDRKASRVLAKGLEEEGFVVEVAHSGEDGEELAAVNEYDLIVFDWLLPGKPGVDVCAGLRARGLATPILMLTARDAVADRVAGLNRGADDYLTKPFALAETEAASALDSPDGRVHLHPISRDADRPSLARLDKLVQIVDADGRVLERSASLGDATLPAPPGLLARLASGEPVIETLPDLAGEPVRVVSLPIEVDGRFRYAVQVGTRLRAVSAVFDATRVLFLGASLAVLGVVVVIGALLTRSALSPTEIFLLT